MQLFDDRPGGKQPSLTQPTKVGGLTLRGRLIALVVGLVFLPMVATSSYFIVHQREQLTAAKQSKSEVMRADLRKKGMAVAGNVAGSLETALAMMEFLLVRNIVTATVQHDEEIKYGIVMNRDRMALVHSDPEAADTVLEGPEDQFAAAQETVTTQELTRNGERILEVISPIHVADKRFTIRFGLSLENLNREIEQSERRAEAEIKKSVTTTLIGAIALMFVGSLVGLFAAGRITRPLKPLLEGVEHVSQGELDHVVETKGVPEFIGLAGAFNHMTKAIKARDDELRENMADLELALEKAEEANRLKSEFLANVSHELRTPLNAIINVPPALLREYEAFTVWHCGKCGGDFHPDETKLAEEAPTENCPECKTAMTLEQRTICVGNLEEHRHLLWRVQQQGEHLLRVVSDLLDFSKLQAGKMQLHCSQVRVVTLLEEVRTTVEGLAAQHGLELKIPSVDAGLSLSADPVKLAQVFINLIGNAIKFTPRGGSVEVTVDETSPDDLGGLPAVRFAVKDTGEGIPKDRLNDIFDSFRQVDGSHTRAHGGTGLGLAITKQLLELHGGHIFAESDLGKGSTFTFVLPKAGPSPKVAPVSPDEPSSTTTRVVVVDDNQIQREIMRLILEREGFETELVAKSPEAIETIVACRPHFVILDVMMPEVSGISLLKQLKKDRRTSEIPVLVSTAYHSNREVAEQLGGIWLPKPWSSKDLLARMEEHGIQQVAKMARGKQAGEG